MCYLISFRKSCRGAHRGCHRLYYCQSCQGRSTRATHCMKCTAKTTNSSQKGQRLRSSSSLCLILLRTLPTRLVMVYTIRLSHSMFYYLLHLVPTCLLRFVNHIHYYSILLSFSLCSALLLSCSKIS